MSNWLGQPMMNPKGKIGKVVNDSNVFDRLLTVEFEDKTREYLWLNNTGDNPVESRNWKWFLEHDGKSKWVRWGK